MPTELPVGLQKALEIVGGQRWPEGDEDGLNRMSSSWADMQRALDAIDQAMQRSRDAVSANMRGAYADAHATWVDSTMRPMLDQLRQEADNYSNLCKNTAADVQYAKTMIIVQLSILAATLAFEWLPGIGQAITASAAAAARLTISQIMKAILQKIASHTVIGAAAGAGLETAIDGAIQGVQMLSGQRTEWNSDLTEGAALGGALGGAMGGALSGGLRGGAQAAVDGGFGDAAKNFANSKKGWALHDLGTAASHGSGEGLGDIATNDALDGKAAPHEGAFTSGALGGLGGRGSGRGAGHGSYSGVDHATDTAGAHTGAVSPDDGSGKGLGLDGHGIATQSGTTQSGAGHSDAGHSGHGRSSAGQASAGQASGSQHGASQQGESQHGETHSGGDPSGSHERAVPTTSTPDTSHTVSTGDPGSNRGTGAGEGAAQQHGDQTAQQAGHGPSTGTNDARDIADHQSRTGTHPDQSGAQQQAGPPPGQHGPGERAAAADDSAATDRGDAHRGENHGGQDNAPQDSAPHTEQRGASQTESHQVPDGSPHTENSPNDAGRLSTEDVGRASAHAPPADQAALHTGADDASPTTSETPAGDHYRTVPEQPTATVANQPTGIPNQATQAPATETPATPDPASHHPGAAHGDQGAEPTAFEPRGASPQPIAQQPAPQPHTPQQPVTPEPSQHHAVASPGDGRTAPTTTAESSETATGQPAPAFAGNQEPGNQRPNTSGSGSQQTSTATAETTTAQQNGSTPPRAEQAPAATAARTRPATSSGSNAGNPATTARPSTATDAAPPRAGSGSRTGAETSPHDTTSEQPRPVHTSAHGSANATRSSANRDSEPAGSRTGNGESAAPPRTAAAPPRTARVDDTDGDSAAPRYSRASYGTHHSTFDPTRQPLPRRLTDLDHLTIIPWTNSPRSVDYHGGNSSGDHVFTGAQLLHNTRRHGYTLPYGSQPRTGECTAVEELNALSTIRRFEDGHGNLLSPELIDRLETTRTRRGDLLTADEPWIKGHLLNDNLGGHGISENLTPLTGYANGRFHDFAEKPMKDAANRVRQLAEYNRHNRLFQDLAVYYRVDATGSRFPRSSVSAERAIRKYLVVDAWYEGIHPADARRLGLPGLPPPGTRVDTVTGAIHTPGNQPRGHYFPPDDGEAPAPGARNRGNTGPASTQDTSRSGEPTPVRQHRVALEHRLAPDERGHRDVSTRDQWGDRRDTAPVSHHRTERFDPSRSTRVDNAQQLHLAGNRTRIDHHIRRFQDENGTWIREYTVTPDLAAHDDNLTPTDLHHLGQHVKTAVEDNLNHRYHLPGSGDQLHITVEPRVVPRDDSRIDTWFDDPEQHPYVKVKDTAGQDARPTQLTWGSTHRGAVLAHEVMHFLGLGEGYTDPDLVLRHPEQDGVMGRQAHAGQLALTPDNLHALERISHSGPVIHDHPINKSAPRGNTVETGPGAPHHRGENPAARETGGSRPDDEPSAPSPPRSSTRRPQYVYRGDTRAPHEIFPNGFSARGTDYDLERHLHGGPGATRSGYVSTSAAPHVAHQFSRQNPLDVVRRNDRSYLSSETTVYRIRPTDRMIDVNRAGGISRDLRDHVANQREWAAIDHIPPENIHSATRVQTYRWQGWDGRTEQLPGHTPNIRSHLENPWYREDPHPSSHNRRGEPSAPPHPDNAGHAADGESGAPPRTTGPGGGPPAPGAAARTGNPDHAADSATLPPFTRPSHAPDEEPLRDPDPTGGANTSERPENRADELPHGEDTVPPLRGEADSRPLPRIVVTPDDGGPQSPLHLADLPDYVRQSTSLGTITAHEVDTTGLGDLVRGLVPAGGRGVEPVGVDRIEPAAREDVESFLHNGRSFSVRSGGRWYEATVRARFAHSEDSDDPTGDLPASHESTHAEMTTKGGTTSATKTTISTARAPGGSVDGGLLAGPYARVGLRAPLAAPAASRSRDIATTEERNFRSSTGSFRAELPVRFEVRLTDERGRPVPQEPSTPTSTTGRAVLRIPHDLANRSAGDRPPEPTTPERGWGTRLDHPGAEAVVDVADRFDEVAARMHPSITRLGAPGREQLRDFLSPPNIRNNLVRMLHGPVLSPDLVSAHGSRGSAVRMSAALGRAELVGVTGETTLRAGESSTSGTALTATTKSGFDASGAVGGSALGVTPTGGLGALTGSYSSSATASTTAGGEHTSKVGMQATGDTGIYRVHTDVSVLTQNGEAVHLPATTYLRVGLPEAAERGLPVPAGTRRSVVTPTDGPRFPPPYLAGKVAVGDVKVAEHGPTNQVLPRVQEALRSLPGFEQFLPEWGREHATAARTGRRLADEQEKFTNERALAAVLSPSALRSSWNRLLGPGVDVQLKRRGLFTNDHTEIRVRAELDGGEHLGQADDRAVRTSADATSKADTTTTLARSWSAGVEGRVQHVGALDDHAVLATPTASLKYSHATERTQAANPTQNQSSVLTGSPASQVFGCGTTLTVEITSHRRPRAWVKRLTPGSPGHTVPETRVLARTVQAGEATPRGALALDPIRGRTTLWVPDGTTAGQDQSEFRPGPPRVRELGEHDPRSIQEMLHRGDRPARTGGLHVEAVTGTDFLRDTGIRALDEAAGGDAVLGLPGSPSRRDVNTFFSPEHVAANLTQLSDHGLHVDGLHHQRRVHDRLGSLGVACALHNPKLVSLSDDIGTENATTGGHTVSESTATKRGWDLDLSLTPTLRPGTDPTDRASYVASSGIAAKPWSRSTSHASGRTISGTVERRRTTPEQSRTALVRMDADVTVLAESHEHNVVHDGAPGRSGRVVTLPGGVFLRVSEEQARGMGVLPERHVPQPGPVGGELAPPRLIGTDQSSSLGLGVFDDPPDLRGLLGEMRAGLGDRGSELLPDSVLRDAMRNQHKLARLTSPAHVQALQDSAMDGGITLLTHTPRVFGRTTHWSQLRMKLGEPEFLDVVHDGVAVDHTVAGGSKHTDTRSRTSGWSAALRGQVGAAPSTGRPGVSTTTGTGAAAEISSGQQRTTTDGHERESTTSHTSTASGPSARYRVPVRFELVTGRGDEPGTAVTTDVRVLRMRVPADDVAAAGHEPATRRGHAASTEVRAAADGHPDAIASWQQEHPTTLPDTAAVESLRGSADLRSGALRALAEAGAGRALTGPGTPGAHAVHGALSPELLQPRITSSQPLRIPHLHALSLLSGEHADVEVHRRLSGPRLVGLSDHVTTTHERTTTSASNAGSTHTTTGSLTGAPGAGRTVLPDPAPDGALVNTSGAEVPHSTEVGDSASGGDTGGRTNTATDEDRSGLVEYDVDYRIVARSGSEPGVVDVHAPSSVHVRVGEADLNGVLHHDVPPSVRSARDRLTRAAEDWRAAELAADRSRHGANDRINAVTPGRERARALRDSGLDEVEAASSRVERARRELERARADHDAAQAQLPHTRALAEEHVVELRANADAALAQLWSAGQARAEAEQTLRGLQQQGRADAIEAAHRARAGAVADERRAAAAHAHWDAELRAATDRPAHGDPPVQHSAERVSASGRELREAEQDLGRARETRRRAEHDVHEADRHVTAAERELDRARNRLHETRTAWWQAKTAADEAVREFNSAASTGPAHAPPGDEHLSAPVTAGRAPDDEPGPRPIGPAGSEQAPPRPSDTRGEPRTNAAPDPHESTSDAAGAAAPDESLSAFLRPRRADR